MECGGKRSATPLWLESLVLRWIRHKHKPKRRRAALAAALHGRGWFCTAETQAKAASRCACRRTPWQRLVLYRRNTSQSGVALRLPPHSMAEAGFVPQKHKPKRRRAALAAALHGRGWFCTAETQAKAASRCACRRTPWQRLVLYRRNTSQSGVALRLPPHSMAEAGFVPQKHKPKRRRASLAAALHGRGWFCTAETQAKRRRAALAAALHITIPAMGCIRRIRSTSRC